MVKPDDAGEQNRPADDENKPRLKHRAGQPDGDGKNRQAGHYKSKINPKSFLRFVSQANKPQRKQKKRSPSQHPIFMHRNAHKIERGKENQHSPNFA